jgi:hypothetical protein
VKDKLKKVSRAHTKYRLKDGTLIPGVTTVLGVLAKPALIKWANNLGLQGIDSNKYVDAAARIGTLAHYLVECHLAKTEPVLDDYSKSEIDQAENAFLKYLEWEKQHDVRVVFSEIPLVSEIYGYGGTIDCYASIDGKPGLLDFKTGKAIYNEHLIQLAAYKQLLNEGDHIVDSVRIIRIGRTEDEGFEEKQVYNLSKHWELFRHLLEVYKLQKAIRGA